MTSNRIAAALLATSVAFALPASAQQETPPQETIQKRIEAKSGEPVQLGVFSRITPECTVGEHEVRVASVAENGTIRRTAARVRPGRIPNCPDFSPEVALFIYRSNPDFTGTDRMEIRVETPEMTQLYQYEVTVE